MAEERPEYIGNGDPRHSRVHDEPEFKRYMGIIRRRIWAVLTCFVIVATLGTVYAFKTTPVYQGVAKILIEKRSPRLMSFEDVVELQASGQDYYKTQRELVLSRAVLEGAMEQPGVRDLPEITGRVGGESSFLAEIRRTVSAVLGASPTSPPEPWERLRSVVSVEHLRNTNLLLVRVSDPQPARAAMLTNAVARSFEQFHVERKLKTSNEAFLFLQEQKVKQEQAMEEAEDALQQFRQQAQVVSLDISDKENPVLTRLARLNKQLTDVQLRRVELEGQFEVVKRALGSGDGTLESANEHLYSLLAERAGPAMAELRNNLVEAEKEVATLSDTYGPRHPQLQAALVKVSMFRGKLRESLTQLVGSLSAELEMLSNQEQGLGGQYEEQNRLALELAKQSLTFNRLQNEVQRQGKLFDVLVERMREVDVTADYAKTNVEVVETADIPKTPVKLRKTRTVLLSVLLGLFLGIALAFVLEYLDDTIKTPEDMEDWVGVPVLGFVPGMGTNGAKTNGFSDRAAVTLVEPTSSATEAYRNIRTSLFFSAPPEEAKVLVVTSGGLRDGKTTTAANLSLVIAQSGKRVLLIDADLRRPRQHQVFDLESNVGLSTVLVGEASLEEAVQKPQYDLKEIENLDVLAAGPAPPNPAELLDSTRMRDLLEQVAEKYDRVIIDTPPALFVADASILSAISDGAIVVVRSAVSPRSQARRLREQLEGVKARILGGILNDVQTPLLRYYYSGYYHYGYSRYYADYRSSYYAGEDEESSGEDTETLVPFPWPD